jgi:long-chain fatty acid transport protein
MTVYKLGYQKVLSDLWTARCGISYGRQPIPSSEILFNILAPGVQEWHFTLGATKKVGEDGEFSMSMIYSPDKKVSGLNPNDPAQSLTIHMHQFNFEIGFSKKF